MNAVSVRVAACLVRGWTRLYTCGLPEAIADARRREVHSDLWELQRDPDGGRGLGVASQLAGRLLLGLPDDLLWRVDHVADDVAARRVAATVVVMAVLVAAIWTGRASMPDGEPMIAARMADCERAAGRPQSAAEFRIRVMDCAGQFFTPRRSADGAPGR